MGLPAVLADQATQSPSAKKFRVVRMRQERQDDIRHARGDFPACRLPDPLLTC